MTGEGETDLSPSAWEARYASGETRWDRGMPAPPFVDLLASGAAPPPGRLAVLGCGRGHDALLFARHGFRVTGFDFAPSAIRTARALAAVAGLDARFEERDIFTLPGEHAGAFDAVLEYTCFCAIVPARRADYVRAVDGLLAPGGFLVALFYPFEKTGTGPDAPDGGPPFLVTDADVAALFGERFSIRSVTVPARSIESRRGREKLVILEKRPAAGDARK